MKTVYVGLSGGVDSSVAALRLKKQGYNVVGVFIKVWHPDFMVCNWEAERLDAMRVAAHLEIPFLTCDAEEAYKTAVADQFIAEYKAGRTPNPDVLCNSAVKFGAFLDFAKNKGADFVATGHYVQKINGQLHRGVDEKKDQSYFLWKLTQDQLDFSLFPVGDTKKSKIRDEATAAKIPTASKKDSQGICFLGHVDIGEFLSHYVDLKEGAVLNEAGEVVGSHDGALIYTSGQRHGFRITTASSAREPHFVVDRNIEQNTIMVAPAVPKLASNQTLTLEEVTLRSNLEVKNYDFQIRYRQTPRQATVAVVGARLMLQPTESIEPPAPGQSVVLYDGAHCIGGGIVSQR